MKMKRELKAKIAHLLKQEQTLVNKRRKLEAIDYEQNEEKRIKRLLGRFFKQERKEDYVKGEYGRVLSYRWTTENNRKFIETTTEYIGFFRWATEIARGTLTDFRFEWEDFADRWEEISAREYGKVLLKAEKELGINRR